MKLHCTISDGSEFDIQLIEHPFVHEWAQSVVKLELLPTELTGITGIGRKDPDYFIANLNYLLGIIDEAIDLGINFFDTANVYSKGRSEEIVGELLQGRRNDIVLATKVNGVMKDGPNNSGLARIHIQKQIKESLKRLRTDHVDLYQIQEILYGYHRFLHRN